MKWAILSFVTICIIRPDVALAVETEFFDLMTLPASTLAQVCQNQAILLSAEDWRLRRAPDPFTSLEELNARENGVGEAGKKGCNELFLWRMLDCTQTDDHLSPNIVPIGKTASTPAEMAKIIDACLREFADKGIAPTR